MSQQIFDISRPLNPTLAVWPGDSPFSSQTMLNMGKGDPVNLTTLTLSSHTGSHADAPHHFNHQDLTIEKLPLLPYLGPATLVTVQRQSGPLTPADFPNLVWDNIERLLVHSEASHQPLSQFPTEIIYPSPELADLMGSHNILLFGSDAPSMDDINSKTLPGHHALRRNQIAILEGLLFNNIPDGEYELVALPLKIEGGDGSPVRAILRTVPPLFG